MSLAVVQSATGSGAGVGVVTLTLAAEPTVGNALVLLLSERWDDHSVGTIDWSAADDPTWIWQNGLSLDTGSGPRSDFNLYTRPVLIGDDLAALQSNTATLDVAGLAVAAVLVELSGLAFTDYDHLGNWSTLINTASAVSTIDIAGLDRNLPTLGIAAWAEVATAVTAVAVDGTSTLAETCYADTGDHSLGVALTLRASGGTGDMSVDWGQSAGFAAMAALVVPDYAGSGWFLPQPGDDYAFVFDRTLIADLGEYVGPWPLPQPTEAQLRAMPEQRELDFFVAMPSDDHELRHTIRAGYYAVDSPVFDAYSVWSPYPPGPLDTPTSDYWLYSVLFTVDPTDPSDPHPPGAHLFVQCTSDWADPYSSFIPPPRPSLAPADVVDPAWLRSFGLYPAAGSTYSSIASGQPQLLDPVAGATAVSIAGAALGLLSAAPGPVVGRTTVVVTARAYTPPSGGGGGEPPPAGDVELSSNPPIALGLQLRGTATVDDLHDPEAVDGALVGA